MLRVKHLLIFALLVTLTLSACQPLTAEPVDQQAEDSCHGGDGSIF